jgi:hypothetical protein
MPNVGESVVAEEVGGNVTVRLPNGQVVNVGELAEVPTGSVVDTRRGTVELTAAAANDKLDRARFWDGLFRVTQTSGARPVTELKLVEKLARCPRRSARGSAVAAARKRPKRRGLWANGTGHFRTTGQRSANTVRGTTWFVQDSCAGTLTRVTSGVVQVRDFGRRKTVNVRAGQRYLAR